MRDKKVSHHEKLNESIARAKRESDPQILASIIPYAQALGMSMHLEEGRLISTMEFSQNLVGDIGIAALHGGTIGALLESSAICTLLWEVEETTMPKTVNLTVEYLRSGRPKNTYSSATITRHGRRIANVQAVAWQDDPEKPIAVAHSHFLLIPKD